MHLQQLLNEVLKGLAFAFGYLAYIFRFSKNTKKHFEYLGAGFERLRKAYLK